MVQALFALDLLRRSSQNVSQFCFNFFSGFLGKFLRLSVRIMKFSEAHSHKYRFLPISIQSVVWKLLENFLYFEAAAFGLPSRHPAS